MENVHEVDIGRLQRLMKVMINPLDSCGEDIVPLQLAYVSWFDRLAESREGLPSLMAGARSGGSGGSSRAGSNRRGDRRGGSRCLYSARVIPLE